MAAAITCKALIAFGVDDIRESEVIVSFSHLQTAYMPTSRCETHLFLEKREKMLTSLCIMECITDCNRLSRCRILLLSCSRAPVLPCPRAPVLPCSRAPVLASFFSGCSTKSWRSPCQGCCQCPLPHRSLHSFWGRSRGTLPIYSRFVKFNPSSACKCPQKKVKDPNRQGPARII